MERQSSDDEGPVDEQADLAGTGEPSAANKTKWMRGLRRNMTRTAAAALRGAADQRQAARRTYLSLAPEARTETALEVIDEALVSSPALGRLTRYARLQAAKRAHVVQFSPGQVLCSMGEPQDAVLVVMKGEVEVTEGIANNPAAITLPTRVSRGGNGRDANPHGVGESAAPFRPEVLQRGGSLGAVDLVWLSNLPRASPSATGLAVGHGPLRASAAMATAASVNGTGGGGSGDTSTSTSSRGPNGTWSLARGGQGLDALRWCGTAVARTPVECVAISTASLAEVVQRDPHDWDVELLVELMESLPMFAPLTTSELRQLARLLRGQVLPGGTVIYRQGSVGSEFFIVRMGQVRLLKQVALDENLRNRLNRMSEEMSAVRDQSMASASALHSGLMSRGSTPRTFQSRTPLPPQPYSQQPGFATSRPMHSRGGPRNELAGMEHRSGAFTHRDRMPASAAGPPDSPLSRARRPGSGLSYVAPGSPPGGARRPGRAAGPQQGSPLRSELAQDSEDTSAWPATQADSSGGARRHSTTAVAPSAPIVPSKAVPAFHSARRGRRRSSSNATADDLLAQFGVSPRTLRNRGGPQRNLEDVANPNALVVPRGAGDWAAAMAMAEEAAQGASSGGDGSCEAAAASVHGALEGGLPAVVPPLPLSRVSGTGGGGGGTSGGDGASAGAQGAVPVYVPCQPRRLDSAQEMVFVELGSLGAGQCFGEVRADGAAVRTSSAVADTRTELLVLHRNEAFNRLSSHVFDFLFNKVPTDGAPPALDPALDASQCTKQLTRSMQWSLYKARLVASVLAEKEERRRLAKGR